MHKILLIIKEMRKYSDKKPAVGFETPFKVLISTILSQRTKDANTEKAAKQLFSRHPDAKTLAKAPVRAIEKLIRQAGFYRVKARRIKKISALLLKKFNGRVPCTKKDLLSLICGGWAENSCLCNCLWLQKARFAC